MSHLHSILPPSTGAAFKRLVGIDGNIKVANHSNEIIRVSVAADPNNLQLAKFGMKVDPLSLELGGKLKNMKLGDDISSEDRIDRFQTKKFVFKGNHCYVSIYIQSSQVRNVYRQVCCALVFPWCA